MYKISAKSLGLKSDFVAYGETKESAIAVMFQWLEVHNPQFLGNNSIERLAEIDVVLAKNVVTAEGYFGNS